MTRLARTGSCHTRAAVSTLPFGVRCSPANYSMSRKTGRAGIELIKKWEGLRLRAYLCPAGVWTIGFGHTRTAKPGMVITPAEAERLLLADLRAFEKALTSLVRVRLNQNQFDALVSLIYNIGPTNFARSTLLKMLNAGDYRGAAAQFGRWTRAGGKVLAGLVSRRAEEAALFGQA